MRSDIKSDKVSFKFLSSASFKLMCLTISRDIKSRLNTAIHNVNNVAWEFWCLMEVFNNRRDVNLELSLPFKGRHAQLKFQRVYLLSGRERTCQELTATDKRLISINCLRSTCQCRNVHLKADKNLQVST